MNETRKLAHFAATTRFEELPPDVVDHFKAYVLDNIACGFVGSVQPSNRWVADMVHESHRDGPCTVIGMDWRTGLSGAALANGATIGGFEADHGSDIVSGHPSATVFPPALAVAEANHADGKEFLTAMVVGYEIVCRVAQAATRAVEDVRGFHGPATNGQFGAAAAAGRLLGLDDGGITNAMGIAGSHCGGLLEFVWEGALTKRLHLARAAQMGLESALLAAKGYTGPSTVLEGKYGFLNAFSPSPNPDALTDGLGEVWTGNIMLMKPYACHGRYLSIVEAIHFFTKDHPLKAGDIAKVTVRAPEFMVHKHTDPQPQSILSAQYSMVFGVALALTRDISDPYVYNEQTLWDADIRSLAARVEAVVDPRFAAYDRSDPRAEVVVELHGGERHVIEVAGFRGLPATPFTVQDATEKLRAYAAPVIPAERTEAIVEAVRGLESLGDVATLAGLTRA